MTEEGMTNSFNEEHKLNARSSIVLTESGIEMLVSPVQLKKAPDLIIVTEEGIIISV